MFDRSIKTEISSSPKHSTYGRRTGKSYIGKVRTMCQGEYSQMSEVKSVGISKGVFVIGLVITILASSLISVIAITQLPMLRGPKGDKGDTGAAGATGPQGLAGDSAADLELYFPWTQVSTMDIGSNTIITFREGIIINFGNTSATNVRITFTITINNVPYTRIYSLLSPVSGTSIYALENIQYTFSHFTDYAYYCQITWT